MLSRLAGGTRAIVATDAIAGKGRVIRRGRRPVCGGVASETVEGRSDVAAALALRQRVVMASAADRDGGLGVIKSARGLEQRGRQVMATIAGIAGAQTD